jgi:tetratricopeptide (TPR) repeat protein
VVLAIGSDLHMDYTAVGHTTHLAARTEQLALPGTIRLTAETLRLVEGFVQVKALGPVPVKGLAEPVEVFELAGASAIRRRLQAAAIRGLTRFVGRQIELTALRQRLERAGAGHGQVTVVVGEAGVGKSRLVYEFIHSHHTRNWLVLESASVSYGKATPYFPVVDLLKRYVQVEDGDDTHTIRAKVTGQVLTLDEALQEVIPARLAFLYARPEDHPFLKLDPLPPASAEELLLALLGDDASLASLKRLLIERTEGNPFFLAESVRFEQGEIWAKAVHYLSNAAERAKARYAYLHAALLCTRAVEVATHAQDLSAAKVQGFALLGDLWSLMGDLAQANQSYEQALEAATDPSVRQWIASKRHRPHTVERDGARIAFYEHGGGDTTLAFANPLAYGLATFQPGLEKLCQEFRILTIDPRGAGASDPLQRPYTTKDHMEDVRAVIEASWTGPVVGIGLSRSGNLLVRLAVAYPALVQRLVPVGTELAQHRGRLIKRAQEFLRHNDLYMSSPLAERIQVGKGTKLLRGLV